MFDSSLTKKSGAVLAALLLVTTFSAYASKEELDDRLKKRNAGYSDYQDRRAMRTQARQERTDMWFDRAMGNPPQTETGLKMPRL